MQEDIHGTNDSCNDMHRAEDGLVEGTFTTRNSLVDDDEAASIDAGSAEARNGSSDNEGIRRGCDTGDQRTELKKTDSNKEHSLDAVIGVEFSVQELQCTRSKLVRPCVPGDIVQRVEMVGDGGNGGGQDGAVLRKIRSAGVVGDNWQPRLTREQRNKAETRPAVREKSFTPEIY